jgi:S1-C subfamily serine protease
MDIGQHEKTHRHIKRAQVLIAVAIAINVFMAAMVLVMMNSLSAVSTRVNELGLSMDELGQKTSANFVAVGQNLSSLSGGMQFNTQQIGVITSVLSELNSDIQRVGNESKAGIAGLKSELNYTGTIDTALEATVLIIWTDKESVVGSGFFVSDGGYAITADHVVEAFDGKTVRVKTRNGTLYIASIEERDEDSDVAILKVSGEGFKYLEFEDSDALSPGSKVFALGAPEGFAFSASEGIVSAVRTVSSIKSEVGLKLDLALDIKVVQTDAAITNGNSGGPLIDRFGKVVGVNSFGISRGGSGSRQDIAGLNFAIASNDAKKVYESVL